MERRTSNALDINGEPTADSTVQLKFDPITVHPLVGATRGQQDYGATQLETLQVFTTQELHTATGGTTSDADVILYPPVRGQPCRRYVVQESEPWEAQSGHWRAIAVREEGN